MKTTKEMKMINILKLIPYANNARTHSDEQVMKLRSSLREFGFVNPVLIDKENNIIAGHGRIMAAKAEGISEVPCVMVEHLTEAQKKAYILADNRLAEDAGWDMELVDLELDALREMDFDISLTGFELSDLEDDSVNVNEFGTDFQLASGDKPPFQQITFTLADEQAETIKNAISEIKKTDTFKYIETFGNENSNGNALYCLVKEVKNG